MVKNNKASLGFLSFCFLVSFLLVPEASAGKARLNWNANSEQDLDGYKVFIGTVPKAQNGNNYPVSVDAGNVTTYTADGIGDTGTTYFSIKAYDTSGNYSDFSAEVHKTPGDVDKDGEVTIFDYNALKSNFGQTSCDNVADIDLTCEVDIFDYNVLKGNFGAHI